MGYIEEFSQRLIDVSVGDTYTEAIKEWVYQGDTEGESGFCICGHPIVRNCIVYNRLTGATIVVGSCCIHKFGIKKEHYNRSRRDYLVFAWRRASTEYQKEFVKDLGLKLKRYHSLWLTDKQKTYLESITGKPYRWKCEPTERESSWLGV